MMTNTLALGTSGGTLAVAIVSALATGALGAYTLLHHQQVFAWMRSIRRKDQTNAELDKPDQWLADLYKAQCRLAHKPCRAEDFEDITQIGTMLRGVADHTPAIAPELARVLERIEEYTDTALPEPGPAAVKIPVLEHRTQLVKAMKQESARSDLARAVVAAQQKITHLKRG
ncbi:hypothetical protein SAMN06272735_9269 [Streptomyces sp. TLI_55]|uniref:hypothetical protein n=1 Tax=Streptomyces sp. TLI_55 TaxID=1938861 RepID=UPI000BD9264B|nr:hypothetical protein [Streptomyces sp. TLI_55]SNX88763.1 hypothetical protein SAMN06272735_9269 [Streptomyces sp. TLI_55]